MFQFDVDAAIFVGSVLLLLGIASSKLSARMGVPALVLFLLVGMLAGEEGIGRIRFDDYDAAHAIGTIALAVILFDGGLGTSVRAIRSAWKPALSLATVGVFITAGLTGLSASFILGLSPLEGMLLGSIVASTDASAVFSVLRTGGTTLPERLSATLEVESGSNDPMAIFMTIGCIEILTGKMEFGLDLLGLFAMQAIIGTASGLGIGFASVWVVNRVKLDAAGLYPVLVVACGLLSFGAAAVLEGSGFLAVYLAGCVLGNKRLAYQRGIRLFNDAGAWLAQIAMFVILGLLSYPSKLALVAPQGLLVAAVLVFVARPLAVFVSVPWFRFNWREMTLLAWVGLKGAVPITLAIFPLLAGIENAVLIFNVVFFIVVVSAVAQGWSLSLVADLLGLRLPKEPISPVTLEISSLQDVDAQALDFTVVPESRAAGHLVKDLALPAGAVISLIARGKQVIPPHGATRIEPGDHVLVVVRNEVAALVTQAFAERTELPLDLPSMTPFPLRPTATIGELQEMYGLQIDLPADVTLVEAIRSRAGAKRLMQGETVPLGPIALQATVVGANGAIEQVGMILLPDDPPEIAPSPSEEPAPAGPAEEPPPQD
ncbi:MAG TPA: potassium/proton antiporter [Pirellulaceae bacterium]|jgi:cell volume regulation protein A|nr:potassium/proton antiporter [Pirellulaceae bacterium]